VNDRGGSWRAKAMGGLLLVLAVAIGARVAWELLAPTLPIVTALVGLGVIYWLIFGMRRR
jgi:hypothetical protein